MIDLFVVVDLVKCSLQLLDLHEQEEPLDLYELNEELLFKP